MLQRGTGAGYLAALRAPRAKVHDILFDCITVDPRWDWQVEDRAGYFAGLFEDLALPAARLAEWIEANDDPSEDTMRASPAVDVLSVLAARGYPGARGPWLRYLSGGTWWHWACGWLEGGDLALLSVAASAISARSLVSPDHEDEIQNLPRALVATLAAGTGVAAELARTVIADRENWRLSQADLTDLPVESLSECLVDAVDGVSWLDVGKELARRRVPFREVAHWVELSGPRTRRQATLDPLQSRWMWPSLAALFAFHDRIDPDIVEVAATVVRRRYRWGDARRSIQREAKRALAAQPAALELAREWRTSPAARLRDASSIVMKQQATVEDIPHIIPVLGRPFTGGSHYAIDTALDTLLRLVPHGPFAGVESIYRRANMSCTRQRAVKLLAATVPDFGATLAFECLWDCEADARIQAIEHVSLAIPGATERLAWLANDPCESEDLRAKAAARLAST